MYWRAELNALGPSAIADPTFEIEDMMAHTYRRIDAGDRQAPASPASPAIARPHDRMAAT